MRPRRRACGPRRRRLTVLFVTHSIEEAIILSERSIVMSAGPGCIDSDAPIDLPRPCDISAPDFNEMRRSLALRLQGHHAMVAA